MIDKLLSVFSWLFSGSSVWVYAICAIGGFGAGAYITAGYYQDKMEAQKLAITEAANKEVNDYATRLAKTTDALERANSRISALSNSNGDLARRLLDADRRETERAKSYSTDTVRTKYAECRRLLSEGNDLLNEGSDLAQRTAVKHDALSNLVK